MAEFVVTTPDYSGHDLADIAQRLTVPMAPDALSAWYQQDVGYLLREVGKLRSEQQRKLDAQIHVIRLRERITSLEQALAECRERHAAAMKRQAETLEAALKVLRAE